MRYVNTAAGGTHGVDVTEANSGGASGDAFSFVNIAAHADLPSPIVPPFVRFDSSLGVMAYHVHNARWGSSPYSTFAGWTFSSSNRIAGRMELYIPSTPGLPIATSSAQSDAVEFFKVGVAGYWTTFGYFGWTYADMTFNSGSIGSHPGQLMALGATVHPAYADISPSGVLPEDTWFRIEFDIEYGGTDEHPGDGSLNLRVYPDTAGTSPTHSVSRTIGWANAGATEVMFGSEFGVADYFFRNIEVNSTGLPGPAVPVVTANPPNQSVIDGDTATFVAAAATYATVQWQTATPGSSTWTDVASGGTDASYDFTATLAMNGHRFRAVFSNTTGSANTASATLTVGVFGSDGPDYEPPLGGLPPNIDAGHDVIGPNSSTVLELVRGFSSEVACPVRITGTASIAMVAPDEPIAGTLVRSDAPHMYASSTEKLNAAPHLLLTTSGHLTREVDATIVVDDVRILTEGWQIPGRLPMYGHESRAVQRVAVTFTPKHFTGTVEFLARVL